MRSGMLKQCDFSVVESIALHARYSPESRRRFITVHNRLFADRLTQVNHAVLCKHLLRRTASAANEKSLLSVKRTNSLGKRVSLAQIVDAVACAAACCSECRQSDTFGYARCKWQFELSVLFCIFDANFCPLEFGTMLIKLNIPIPCEFHGINVIQELCATQATT